MPPAGRLRPDLRARPRRPADPRPGQFYMLAAGDRWGGGAASGPTCRARSPSPAPARRGGGADLQFLLEDVGPGTRRLGRLAGEALMLLGPLGAGFRPPAGARPCWSAAASARRRSSPARRSDPARPRVLLGFRSARARRGGGAVRRRGRADHRRRLGGSPGPGHRAAARAPRAEPPATVYACGPPAMLEAVRALCAERTRRPSWRWRRGWPAATGPASGAWCRPRDGYNAYAWMDPSSRAAWNPGPDV